MRHYSGLEQLLTLSHRRLSKKDFAQLLYDDLTQVYAEIYGELDEDRVVLMRLELKPNTLSYDAFDHRLDLTLTGQASDINLPPVTYGIYGRLLKITGRCSIHPKVCGSDWYLNPSLAQVQNGILTYKYKLNLDKIYKMFTKPIDDQR